MSKKMMIPGGEDALSLLSQLAPRTLGQDGAGSQTRLQPIGHSLSAQASGARPQLGGTPMPGDLDRIKPVSLEELSPTSSVNSWLADFGETGLPQNGSEVDPFDDLLFGTPVEIDLFPQQAEASDVVAVENAAAPVPNTPSSIRARLEAVNWSRQREQPKVQQDVPTSVRARLAAINWERVEPSALASTYETAQPLLQPSLDVESFFDGIDW